MLVEAELCDGDRLHPIAMEQDPDHVLHGGLLADQEALVLTFRHKHAIVNPHQASLLHLQRELTLSPRVTANQLRGPGVVVQDQGPGHGLADHHLHAQVKQLWIPMLHLELAKELPY